MVSMFLSSREYIKSKKGKANQSSVHQGSFTLFFVIFTLLFSFSAQASVIPNDPFLGEEWYLQKINAPSAWDSTVGSSGVIVAVLDTGVDINHPDLAENIWKNSGEIAGDGLDNDHNGFIDDINGWNFVEGNNDPNPVATEDYTASGLVHGTLLAGIIAAVGDNASGVVGIGWHTRIMPVRVLDSRGSGNSGEVSRGIDYAVRNGAQIINLSFTTFNSVPDVDAAIARAKNAGVLVVAAAGNDNGTNIDLKPVYPVCSDGPAGENWVLGVSAVGQNDVKTSFSNYGSFCIDLSAPGEKIFGTQPSSVSDMKPYGGWWSGTSVAAPMVSGVAALLRAISPKITRNQIIDILKNTAVPIDDVNSNFRGRLGWGRIDAAAAVRQAILQVQQSPAERFVVSSDSGTPTIWLLDGSGNPINAFLAYTPTFTGGVRIATGDVDGDGAKEIISGAGFGGGPHIRVFNTEGTVKSQFFAFPTSFRGGVTVASGDVDGDGRDEIVVGSGKGAGPVVKIFDLKGQLKSQFLAYGSTFLGGVEVATGDVDGDGISEIITGAGPGGGPHIREFDSRGNLKGQFFAFDSTYRGGLRLAVADTDGDRRAEILATRGSTDTSEVRVFSSVGTLRNSFVTFADRRTVLAITAADNDHDGKAEITVAAAGAKTAELRQFLPLGVFLSSFPLPPVLKSSLRLTVL